MRACLLSLFLLAAATAIAEDAPKQGTLTVDVKTKR